MIDFVAFGIILDDLVFADGRTALGVLGGGGPQTAFGMRLPALAGWSKVGAVGLIAGVGSDLPDAEWRWLASAGIDVEGVRARGDLPTPRAWQVLEADGRRTQVWRVEPRVIGAQLRRTLERIPAAYHAARGFHLGVHPDEPDVEFIRQLGKLEPQTADRRPPTISLEPFKPAERPPSDAALRDLCSAADVFSPNLAEAQSLVGSGAPDELARRLADAGAPVVTLRMGADGALVRQRGATEHVPAVPVHVADTTGAGNAYCGAFLAGYVQTNDARTAARYGAVAASFLVEQIGLPPIDARLREEASRRFEWINDRPRDNLHHASRPVRATGGP
jgi:sugar/nucleoside kinase (ribokinase family)